MPAKRKTRTREHVIADLSINFVERQALLCGFSVERAVHDYGIDLLLHTYSDKGEIEPGRILIQVKSSDSPTLKMDGDAFALKISMADLRWWLVEPMPVILVLYDAQNDSAYWLHIQGEFADDDSPILKLGQKHRTLHIQTANCLDAQGIKQIGKLKETKLKQLEKTSHDQ